MKSLFLILSVIPLIATAQSRKVQFEIDSSLYWEAARVVLVMEVNGEKDTLEFDSYTSNVFRVNGPCSGYLVWAQNEFWYNVCSFSIKELKEDSILLFATKGHDNEPIFLTKDILQSTQTIHVPMESPITAYLIGSLMEINPRLLEMLEAPEGHSELDGGEPAIRRCGISDLSGTKPKLSEMMESRYVLSVSDGGAPIIRGCRGNSGVNIDPKSFVKPVSSPETDLLGVAPEFENEIDAMQNR